MTPLSCAIPRQRYIPMRISPVSQREAIELLLPFMSVHAEIEYFLSVGLASDGDATAVNPRYRVHLDAGVLTRLIRVVALGATSCNANGGQGYPAGHVVAEFSVISDEEVSWMQDEVQGNTEDFSEPEFSPDGEYL